ncbi:MAG: hypothetical protein M1830_009409 [Pleopsidium flavum]|nr:MAG: hypothetical protein M1830_009409 [Pleopsidium flavum]
MSVQGPESAGTAAIEVEPFNDTDSACGDDLSTYTASVTSTVFKYPMENGRRYHAYSEGSYVMPNDETELDRLDMTHRMMTLLCDERLHLAPIGELPQRILDVGTGTGIWCIEMGDQYPSAEIVGNDLSPEQPRNVPPNVKFEVDDVEMPWTYNIPFDYIHCRYMAASITNWPQLVERCFRHTKPSGLVEFQDYDLQYYSRDGSMKSDSSIAKWINLLLETSRKAGRDPCPGASLEGWVRDAGFTEIHHEKMQVPIGLWPKDKRLKTIGAFNLTQILEGLEAFSLALFTRVLGWSVDEVQVLLALVRKDLRDPSIHAQFDFHVVWARKPGKPEQ